jgi:hypothetical protein
VDFFLGNLDLTFFAVLFAIGYFAGRWNERRHYASIRAREQEFAGVLVFTNRFPPPRRISAARNNSRSGPAMSAAGFGSSN